MTCYRKKQLPITCSDIVTFLPISHSLSSAKILFTLLYKSFHTLSIASKEISSGEVVQNLLENAWALQNGLFQKSFPNPSVHTTETRTVNDLPISNKDTWITLPFLHLLRGVFQCSACSWTLWKAFWMITRCVKWCCVEVAVCWKAAVIWLPYVGLLGMASDNGRKRGKCSLFTSQSSLKIKVKECLLGMRPFTALPRAGEKMWCCPTVKINCTRSCLCLLHCSGTSALHTGTELLLTHGTSNFRTAFRKQCWQLKDSGD